ncbi:MAG: DUF4143 domain-containing protein [Steroidobacteraceae bacterium]
MRLPAYAVNRTRRLIEAPKVYWGDTGVAMHLAEVEEPGGAHFENLVLQDLLAWRDARIERAELGHWRTATGEEVDFVIEAGGKLLPVEVKATARPRLGDATHLRTFRAEYGRKSRASWESMLAARSRFTPDFMRRRDQPAEAEEREPL